MQIGLFHGYELVGSGSNEYNRYLAKTLISQSHTVHIICREKHPEKLDFVGELWNWCEDGSKQTQVLNKSMQGCCVLHRIPCGPIYPVYLTDKQRPGEVKAFVDLSDEELQNFKQINQRVLRSIFDKVDIEILLANHIVMQPSVALQACRHKHIPLVIFPHGSAIEYTVKKDQRYYREAQNVLAQCDGLIIGNNEVRDRLCYLFPELKEQIIEKTQIVGVGVDSALFTPVPKQKRGEHLSQYIDTLASNGNGKNPQLLADLYDQLELGNRQIVSEYYNRYTQDVTDTDVKEKLARLDVTNPVLIFVGALTAGKGIQSLLCALPIVLKQLPKIQLVLVGSGAYREVLEALIYALVNQDQELLFYLAEKGFDLDNNADTGPWQDVMAFIQDDENLQQLFAYSSAMEKQVMFLGRMDHEQLSGIFPCADVAIFPSVVAEAYPLVLMESLANGVLPLVSDFSGFKEGIEDLNQFLPSELVQYLKIPMQAEQRIEGIAKNIMYLVEKTQLSDLSGQLSNIARQNYDWHHRARAMFEALKIVRKKYTETRHIL